MKKPSRRPKFAITLGVLLLSGATVLAWLWFYTLEPIRRFNDAKWISHHSELARWEKEKDHYSRTGFPPSRLSGPQGLPFYGDKRSFEAVLDRLSRKSRWFELEGCECCSMSCLAPMSNHGFESISEWVTWYSINKDKTQEEWIQQGFAEKGFRIALPPSKSDAVTLLGVLVTRSSDSQDVDFRGERRFEAPQFLRYNAFRWLRDMGFDPIEFLLEGNQPEIPQELVEGLRQFRDFSKEFPLSNHVGLLEFANPPQLYWQNLTGRESDSVPRTVHLIVCSVIGILALSGFFLTRHGIRALCLKSAPALAASHRPDTAGDR